MTTNGDAHLGSEAFQMSGAPPGPPPLEVVDRLLQRLETRVADLGARLVDRYRSDIVDYRALSEQTLRGDVMSTAIANLEELVGELRAGATLDDTGLERFRRSAVRRLHQGISVRGLLHAYRLWGQIVWEELLRTTSPSDRDEREAVLSMAGRIMAHVDAVSAAVAEAYLDEAAGVWRDREVIRRDLLEQLLSSDAAGERVTVQAAAFSLKLAKAHIVVVARHEDPATVGRGELRAALARTRERLKPAGSPLLIGVREDEVVAIYPAPEPTAPGEVDEQARSLAADLPDFVVGIGRRHADVKGIAASYQDAIEAIHIALSTGTRTRAVAFAFSDVLLDHILSSSPHAPALLEDTMGPLLTYDATKQADLVLTLRTYFETGFNLTRSAAYLHVHANTVVYRLQRIERVTGRDPFDPDDLLLLLVGLKLVQSGRASPS